MTIHMNIKYILSFLIFLLHGTLFSQIPLTIDSELLRGGDFLNKIEVPFVNPGSEGKNVVWEFCRLSDGHSNLWQTISKSDTGIDILEYDRMSHFELKDDILYYKGARNGISFVEYQEGRRLLKYPLQYGDSISGTCYGKGCSEDGLSYTIKGIYSTIADGTGSLTDGEDEMPGITRLHLRDEISKAYETGTVERLVSDRYLWYAEDHSYPIMESVKTLLQRYGTSDVVERVSYSYLHAQSRTNGSVQSGKDATITGKYASRRVEIVKTTLSSVDLKLTVDYILDAEASLSLTVTDIAGNILGSTQYHSEKGEEGQISISLAHRPFGSALMLNVKNGDQQVTVIVNE